MNKDRWKQIDELFDAVLELPENEREAFLADKCATDPDLKAEVTGLLNAGRSADNFMENSAMNVMARDLASRQTNPFDNSFLNKTIGNYRIKRPIGAGGMGEVYLAHDVKLDRNVALKILPKEFVADIERVKRFELEARAVSALNHPNIVTVFDVGKFEDINYIATEFVEGETVRELIGKRQKLKDVLPIVIQTCEALSAAHSAGIIHRDIKPENIMIRPDGYVKVLDFGLAKLANDQKIDGSFAGTMKGVVIGTPAYMSPEQISDEKVDHRTDLWSLGVVLYELLTGKNPFKMENPQAIFQAILSTDPPPPSSLNDEVSAELDQVLVKALEKDADLSYQNAADLRADLKRVKREIDSSPSWSTRSAGYPYKTAAAPKRSRVLPYFFGAALIAAFLAIGGWYLTTRSTKPAPKVAGEWINAKNSQLTVSPDIEGYPSLSPDGRAIVYASDSNDDRNIFWLRVGGKNPVNLTKDCKENDTMPAFSSDGKLIAFRSERTPAGIYVMEETGENVRRVSDIGFHPTFSPDGGMIAVSDKAAALHTVHTVPNSRLWIIDLKTGEKKIIETSGDAIMPNWSPDGSRIAFWYVSEGRLPDIATVSLKTGAVVPLVTDASSDWNPVWSPDGKYIYYSSDRGGNMNLWRVAFDEQTGKPAGEPESVSSPSKYTRHISFSRDGRMLAYVRYESQSNIQSLAFDPRTLKVTGEPTWVTRGDREVGSPELSPDFEEYVARQPDRTREDLVAVSKDGQSWRNLTNDRFRERVPRWSPDGRKIFFASDRTGKYQIWSIDRDGTGARQITFTEKFGAAAPVFSPDGGRIVYTEIDGNMQHPFILDLSKTWQEQTPRPLPPIPDYDGAFAIRDWSKDGNKLLVIFLEPDGDESGIGMYDIKAQTYTRLTPTGSTPAWLNDSRNFLYNDKKGIFICDTSTKKITPLFIPPSYEIQQPRASPDNKFVYYRYLQVDADVWLLEPNQTE